MNTTQRKRQRYKRRLTPVGEVRLLTVREVPPMSLADEPSRAHDYWRKHVSTSDTYNHDKEHMLVLFLNTRRIIKGFEVVSVGNLDSTICHPREIFRSAIVASASAIVVMHNHPSGDPTPSEGDIRITRNLIRAGELLQVPVLDHVIVADNPQPDSRPYGSLRELGYFYQ